MISGFLFPGQGFRVSMININRYHVGLYNNNLSFKEPIYKADDPGWATHSTFIDSGQSDILCFSLPEKHCSTLSIGLLHPGCNAVWSISSAIRCLWQPVCACMSDSNNWTEDFRRGLSEVMEFPYSRSSCPWHHSGRVQEQVENCFVEEMLLGRLWGYLFIHLKLRIISYLLQKWKIKTLPR